MPMPQQLPQIPILWTRYPDARKAIFQHELQQKSGILAVGFRLPDSLGLDLRRIADPQLETKLCQQPLEPACISGSLHAYPHTNSLLLQVSIELLCLSITVFQFLFTILTSLFQQKCNRLKARVVIYAYQHHVRLLLSEPMVVMQPKCTVEGADIVMQSRGPAR